MYPLGTMHAATPELELPLLAPPVPAPPEPTAALFDELPEPPPAPPEPTAALFDELPEPPPDPEAPAPEDVGADWLPVDAAPPPPELDPVVAGGDPHAKAPTITIPRAKGGSERNIERDSIRARTAEANPGPTD